MSYRLGIIAFATKTGLGYQTRAIHDFLHPDKTMVIDISSLERIPIRVMEVYSHWYPDGKFIYGVPTTQDLIEFVTDLDVVFVCENPINHELYRIAKERGVKVITQPNFEFADFMVFPAWGKPDMLLLPTMWHFEDMKAWGNYNNVKVEYLHCPVDRTHISRRRIDKAKRFIHIAGRPAAHDRNGTNTFLEAVKAAKNYDIKPVVYTQSADQAIEIESQYPNVEVKLNVVDNRYMYQKGDVLVMPRRYGGLCLPQNEALAAGMPVIMPDISPNNQFLPHEWLVHAEKVDQFEPRTVIDIYECKPYELLLKMIWFTTLSEEDMLAQSDKADELAESISWSALKPKYEEAFEKLCQ